MKRKITAAIFISFLVSISLTFLFQGGLFQSWQNKLADGLFSPKDISNDILIIAIDDISINEIGRWPWDRSVHSQLINEINKSQPKAIGIDISFFESSNSKDDNELAKALQTAGNVVLAAEIINGKLTTPIEIFAKHTDFGIVNTIAGSDGITRHIQLSGHFSTKLAQSNSPQQKNPPTEDGLLRINFSGSPGSYNTISFADALNGRVSENIFKDKIILIDATHRCAS